jgi:hypothetical protein
VLESDDDPGFGPSKSNSYASLLMRETGHDVTAGMNPHSNLSFTIDRD